MSTSRMRLVPPAPERTPDRPGPGPVPPQVLRSLDLAVMRRVESLIPGEHLTPQVGGGTDLAMIRPYRPGDDVRHIDWNVTARMNEPHVRVHVGERAMTAWLVLDVSASMTFGTADRRKADVAEGVALTVGHVATRRGQPARRARVRRRPRRACSSRARAGSACWGCSASSAASPAATAPAAPRSASATSQVAALARARGLVVVVSDFRGPMDWEGPLRSLRGRHGVLAVEVRDPREMELTPMGDVWVMDPETGRQVAVNTSRKRVRAPVRRGGRGRARGGGRGAAPRGRRPRRALHAGRLAARVRPPPPPRRGRRARGRAEPRGRRGARDRRAATRSRPRELRRADPPLRAGPRPARRRSSTWRCSSASGARRPRSATRR